MNELQQVRSDTSYLVDAISNKMYYLDEECEGCKGSGLCPPVMGMSDPCVLCFGKGKKLDLKKSFKKVKHGN